MLLLQMVLAYQIIAMLYIVATRKLNPAKYMFGITIVLVVFMVLKYILRWA